MERKLPLGHSWVLTEDGSYTLFSENFQEACHSTTGAHAETILHYVNGCKVLERLNDHHPFTILEVGFGLGVGLLATLEKIPKEKSLRFISLEIDRNLLDWFRLEHPELHLEWEGNLLKSKTENREIIIISGDARKALPEFLKDSPILWHAIYQDAFSPKKNPILWTKEWFTLLKAYSHEEVILSTYSASSSIRKSLIETGWKLSKGDKFGPKRTSTRAMLKGESDPEILFQLERSPVTSLSDLTILKS